MVAAGSRATRVVFLVEAPLGRRDYMRFGIGPLQTEGFDVSVIDLTSLLQPAMSRGDAPEEVGVEIRRPETMIGAAELVAGLVNPETMFVCLLGYRRGALAIFRALGSRARYALLATNAVPYGNVVPRASMVSHRVLQLRATDWVGALVSRLPIGLLGIGPAELVIAGGERSLTPFETRLAGPNTRVLWAHALDYDLFMAAGGESDPPEAKHIVFLDQFFEGHPDQWQRAEPFCDPKTYYPNLVRAFDDVERRLALPVVIAAHPRADYEDRDPRFGGREVVFGRTLDLVRGARLVLAHDSTSVGMAVHFEKPVCFITDDGVQRSRVRRESAQFMADWLGRPIHNLDGPAFPKWDRELEFDDKRYRAYRRAFLKTDRSPELPSWKIFSEYLRGRAKVEAFGRLRFQQ